MKNQDKYDVTIFKDHQLVTMPDLDMYSAENAVDDACAANATKKEREEWLASTYLNATLFNIKTHASYGLRSHMFDFYSCNEPEKVAAAWSAVKELQRRGFNVRTAYQDADADIVVIKGSVSW